MALVIFLWKVYTGPSDIGSADKMYDNLACAAERVQQVGEAVLDSALPSLRLVARRLVEADLVAGEIGRDQAGSGEVSARW